MSVIIQSRLYKAAVAHVPNNPTLLVSMHSSTSRKTVYWTWWNGLLSTVDVTGQSQKAISGLLVSIMHGAPQQYGKFALGVHWLKRTLSTAIETFPAGNIQGSNAEYSLPSCMSMHIATSPRAPVNAGAPAWLDGIMLGVEAVRFRQWQREIPLTGGSQDVASGHST